MNYSACYNRLMERARGRTLVGLKDRHHVIPRCMGGGDSPSNLIYLTPEEHYIAHQLLVKMYPRHTGLAYAAVRMAKQCSGRRAYGWLRKRDSAARSGVPKSPQHRARIAAALRGSKRGPLSPARCAAMSAVNRGNKNALGLIHSPDVRARISAAQRGNTHLLGHKHTPEARAKMSAAKLGKTHSPETRAKMSAAHKRRRQHES